jgi:hypothetical protein
MSARRLQTTSGYDVVAADEKDEEEEEEDDVICLSKKDGDSNESETDARCLEAEVWKNLPVDLLERVLASLPLLTLLEFRTVCKAWASLPSSPRFRRLCSQVANHAYTYLFVFKEVAWSSNSNPSALDSSSGVWYSLNPSFFLPQLKSSSCWPLSKREAALYTQDIVAADGSFFCRWSSHDEVSVCNPATRSVRMLPPPPLYTDPPHGRVALVVDKQTFAFKLFVVSEDRNGDRALSKLEVYDSIADAWKRLHDVPDDVVGYNVHSILFKGIWFFIDLWSTEYCCDFAYDVDQDRWTGVDFLKSSPRQSSDVHLIQCCNHLLMVSTADLDSHPASEDGTAVVPVSWKSSKDDMMTHLFPHASTVFCIWEVNPWTKECTEVAVSDPMSAYQGFTSSVPQSIPGFSPPGFTSTDTQPSDSFPASSSTSSSSQEFDETCRQLDEHERFHYWCVIGHNDLVIIKRNRKPGMLTYSLRKKRWMWTLSCPDFSYGFSSALSLSSPI